MNFKPSRTTIIPRQSRLMRIDGWTTNGYWLIKTTFEPNYLSELKETFDGKPNCKAAVNNALKSDNKELLISHIFAEVNDIYALLQTEDKALKVWVNPYFLNMFRELGRGISFYGSSPRKPVVVKDASNQVVGLLMPSTIYEELSDYLK